MALTMPYLLASVMWKVFLSHTGSDGIVDDEDWDEEQNQDLPWAAKAIAKPVDIEYPMIAYSSEKVMLCHCS